MVQYLIQRLIPWYIPLKWWLSGTDIKKWDETLFDIFFHWKCYLKGRVFFSVKKLNVQTLVNQKIIIVVQCLECIGRQNGLYFPSHWRLTLVLTKRSDYIIFLLPKKAKILICVFLLNIDKDCFLLFLKEQVDFIGDFQSKVLWGEK